MNMRSNFPDIMEAFLSTRFRVMCSGYALTATVPVYVLNQDLCCFLVVVVMVGGGLYVCICVGVRSDAANTLMSHLM